MRPLERTISGKFNVMDYLSRELLGRKRSYAFWCKKLKTFGNISRLDILCSVGIVQTTLGVMTINTKEFRDARKKQPEVFLQMDVVYNQLDFDSGDPYMNRYAKDAIETWMVNMAEFADVEVYVSLRDMYTKLNDLKKIVARCTVKEARIENINKLKKRREENH